MTTTVRAADAPPVVGQDVAIEIGGIGKTFTARHGRVVALQELDLDVERGQFVCIVGPSGCGKTTLLNILGGLETPTTGVARFRLPDNTRPPFSIVFQEGGVFPWLTVLENAAYGLRLRGVPRVTREQTARRILAQVGLADFASAYPRQLSGGMRQRVNLARAFANDPEILLMDEPFASVDEQTKLLLQDELLRLWEADRKTVLFITHSVDEAIRLGDRILVMSARPGRVKADLRVTLPHPRDVFELQSDPEFVRLRATVWNALKEEVLNARAQTASEGVA